MVKAQAQRQSRHIRARMPIMSVMSAIDLANPAPKLPSSQEFLVNHCHLYNEFVLSGAHLEWTEDSPVQYPSLYMATKSFILALPSGQLWALEFIQKQLMEVESAHQCLHCEFGNSELVEITSLPPACNLFCNEFAKFVREVMG
jgi:hypothetical protein